MPARISTDRSSRHTHSSGTAPGVASTGGNLLADAPVVWFDNPASFDPATCGIDHKLHEEARWIVHKIISLRNFYRKRKSDWVNISQQTMRTFIHPSHYKAVVGALISTGAIECNGAYKIGVHSMGWRLGADHLGRVVRHRITKKSMVAKLLLHRIRLGDRAAAEAELSAVHRHLLASLRLVRIDRAKAYANLAAAPQEPRKAQPSPRKVRRNVADERQHLCRLTVDQIADGGEPDFTIDEQGRVHTPVTRLATEARSALTIAGQPLVSIDIANSQLIFFSLLLVEHALVQLGEKEQREGQNEHAGFGEDEDEGGATASTATPAEAPFVQLGEKRQREGQEEGHQPAFVQLGEKRQEKEEWDDCQHILPPDSADFVRRVMAGTIYEHLMTEHRTSFGNERAFCSRKKFKAQFFAQVIYGDNRRAYASETDLALLFRAMYPSVWTFITQRKDWRGGAEDQDDSFKKLSVQMQRREANFVIGRVCSRLMTHHAEVPLLTIHDSILTTPEHVETVNRMMGEEFARLGIRPKLRIEQ